MIISFFYAFFVREIKVFFLLDSSSYHLELSRTFVVSTFPNMKLSPGVRKPRSRKLLASDGKITRHHNMKGRVEINKNFSYANSQDLAEVECHEDYH